MLYRATMSEIEAFSDNETKSNVILDAMSNIDQFQQMLKICRENKQFPLVYIEDMNKMYSKCDSKQKKSTNLCDLILKGLKNISRTDKNSFQYAANVFNELLQLSKRDSQTENYIASTSNDTTSIINKLENETENISEINKSNDMFKEFIDKCYQNPKFPNSNIEVIDNLYKSLPSDFVDSKYFLQLLKEVNQVIWPDSGTSLYVHVEHVYDQLLQFKMSMKAQDSKISLENEEMNTNKLMKLKKLKVALKKVRKQIKVLDECEMDINHDSNFNIGSAYILKDKYEKKALEIYKRMCKLRGEPDFLEEQPLRFKQTNNSLVNKTIEKFYNLNKSFPDYFEIYTLLKMLNEKKKLNWNEKELKNISHDAFIKLGKQLKSRRLNEYFSRLLNVTKDKDPAEENAELKRKLDESNKKLYADLNALTEKFKNKQEFAEEPEGSSLNDTEYENSSDDNCEKFKHINIIPVKRKRTVSSELENNGFKNKCQKTIYMKSVDLTPTKSVLDISSDAAKDERIVNTKTISGDTTVKNNVDDVSNEKTDIDIEQVTDELFQTENINDCDENVKKSNVIDDESLTDNENSGILVIDEDVLIDESICKKRQQSNIEKITVNCDTITIDSDDEPVFTEPEVIIHEDIDDTVKINKFDNPNLEITICDTSKATVNNKKSLESIIKSMNFEKKYKWDKQTIQKPMPSSSTLSRDMLQHHLGNSNNNLNENLVNRWVMNDNLKNIKHPPKHAPPQYVSLPKQYMHSKQSNKFTSNQKMQSSFQKSTTERQVTQCIMNTVQQQRNFTNNQSVMQQRVTMTTMTTVQKIVRHTGEPVRHRIDRSKNLGRHPDSSQSNSMNVPELIELD